MTLYGYKITWRTWLALVAALALGSAGLIAYGVFLTAMIVSRWCGDRIERLMDWGLPDPQ